MSAADLFDAQRAQMTDIDEPDLIIEGGQFRAASFEKLIEHLAPDANDTFVLTLGISLPPPSHHISLIPLQMFGTSC